MQEKGCSNGWIGYFIGGNDEGQLVQNRKTHHRLAGLGAVLLVYSEREVYLQQTVHNRQVDGRGRKNTIQISL